MDAVLPTGTDQHPLTVEEPNEPDLRPLLRARLAKLEAEEHRLLHEHQKLDESLAQLRQDIEVHRGMLRIESRRLGSSNQDRQEARDLEGAGQNSGLLGMGLSEIAALFIEKGLSKEGMLKQLVASGYPFGESNPHRSVHLAWVNAGRKLAGKGKAAHQNA